jgi:hypothetical protein
MTEPTPAILATLETKRVQADGYSIIVPSSFKTGPWQGDDSSGWSFEGKQMSISSESGPYGSDAKNYGYLNFRESQKIIDGERAKVAIYEMPDPKQLIDPSKKYCVAAHFETSERVRSELSLSACFETPQDEHLATQIIESIKFDAETK